MASRIHYRRLLPDTRQRRALVASGYVLLAIIYTWPAAFYFTTRLPHDLGDPVMSLTLLQWNATTPIFSDRWWDGVGHYPLRDTVTFSDPRLGLTLIAAPVFWLTGSMVAGYNAAYILSFALSALAAHLLVYSLTRSHAAALVAGVAYGFAPFRAAHLAHLELLASFWMPIVLLALHRWHETGRRAWLVLFAGSLAAQGFFCAYYVPMIGIVIAAWLLWFAYDRRRLSQLAGPILAGLIAIVLLLPLFLRYHGAHERSGFQRTRTEIEHYSADLNGLWSASHDVRLLPAFETRSPEGQIFPGLAILVVIGLYLWRRALRVSSADAADRNRSADDAESMPSKTSAVSVDKTRTWRRWLLAVAAVAGLLAAAAAAFGPLRLNLGIASLSVSELRKPFTILLVALAAYGLTSARIVAAVRAKSLMAFYLLAAVLMLLLAMGPNPTAFGVPFLYESPYSWLVKLPGFASLRAPARFAMPMALMLAVAAGLAWARIRPHGGRGARWTTPALAAIIVAESWVAPTAALAPHPSFAWPEACAGLPRLELPFGDIERGAAVQHRALLDGVRSVNGASGFEPPFVVALQLAAERRDTPALIPLARRGPLCVSVDAQHEEASALAAWVQGHTGATTLAAGPAHRFFHLPAAPQAEPLPPGEPLPLREARERTRPVKLPLIADGDRMTAWIARGRQNAATALSVALGCSADITHVALSQGAHAHSFPRVLRIEGARRRRGWRLLWEGPTVDRLVEAAIADPRTSTLVFPVEGSRISRLRLRLRTRDRARWAIAELAVYGRCRGSRAEE